ncbi:MAG: translation initiation factor IF-3 [Candidatus Binatia bacterium]
MAYRGRGPRFVPPPEETHRINRKIRAPQVRLIGAAGEPVGIVPIDEALRLAEVAGLDLVEIAPTAQPPVCRVLDYGKFKYQQHKKENEAKKKSTVTTVKELRLGYRTDIGDIKRQTEKAREFLEEGDRVKFLLRFRGREMAYQNLGREKLLGVCDALKDCAIAEGSPRMEGRMMGILLAPSKKRSAPKPPKPSAPKVAKEAGAAKPEAAEAEAEAPAADDKIEAGSPTS